MDELVNSLVVKFRNCKVEISRTGSKLIAPCWQCKSGLEIGDEKPVVDFRVIRIHSYLVSEFIIYLKFFAHTSDNGDYSTS